MTKFFSTPADNGTGGMRCGHTVVPPAFGVRDGPATVRGLVGSASEELRGGDAGSARTGQLCRERDGGGMGLGGDAGRAARDIEGRIGNAGVAGRADPVPGVPRLGRRARTPVYFCTPVVGVPLPPPLAVIGRPLSRVPRDH